MSTNKEMLIKGVKFLSGALPLLFLGPVVIYNAFMNKENNWHYLVLALGIAVCISAMALTFVGLKTVMKGIFNN